jgi:hypothetical protein
MSEGWDAERAAAERAELERAVERYVALFETLSRGRVGELADLCARDVRFRDPFNDVRGVELFQAAMAKMFDDVVQPRFTIHDWAISGRTAYLRWSFDFRTQEGGAPWSIEGMSEVRYDEHARVMAHLDHWDASRQLYEKLPVIGFVLRKIRQRLGLPNQG